MEKFPKFKIEKKVSKEREGSELEKEYQRVKDVNALVKRWKASERFIKKASKLGDFEIALRATKELKEFNARYRAEHPDEEYTQEELEWDAWLSSGAHTPPPESEPDEDPFEDIFMYIFEEAKNKGDLEIALKIAKEIGSTGDEGLKLIAYNDIIENLSEKRNYVLAMKIADEELSNKKEVEKSVSFGEPYGFSAIAIKAMDNKDWDIAFEAAMKIKDKNDRLETLDWLDDELYKIKKLSAKEEEIKKKVLKILGPRD